MSRAYYNEHDPFAAAWLRNLIAAGHIAPGDVDERDIQEVQADDVRPYTQVHLFAGIGGWSYALRLAGWPDDRPVWTGSCPCQPWSVGNTTGGRDGYSDDRHLWPFMRRLVGIRKPPAILGEQVANAIGKGWLDLVFGDLEDSGYACAAAVLPALAVGARHERKRLFWCADAGGKGWEGSQQIAGVSLAANASQSFDGDPLARAWSALDGDISGLLHCDGLSVVLERRKLAGYGNAIVPQVAAEFVMAYMEASR